MCLDKLARFDVTLDKNKVGVGWKVFRRRWGDGKFIGEYFSSGILPRRRWLNEKDHRSRFFKNKRYKKIESRYPFGWHVFLKKKDAVSWKGSLARKHVVGVKFRNIVATGYQAQGEKKTIVAKEILITK